MNKPGFTFKSRMSVEDWEVLNIIVQRENPKLSDTSWIINQITKLTKTIAGPLMQDQIEDAEAGTKEKCVFIPELCYDNTTNHEILRRFSQLKKKPLTQIIQKYIIDYRIIAEEMRQINEIKHHLGQ